MISLAGRDIQHAWGKFVFTGIGLGLLIGVTLSMAGIYRGMVEDAKVLLDNSGADLWVVQQDTLGPYAESSSVYDDLYRGILSMEGVARAANVTYLTMQVRRDDTDVRAMVVGVVPGGPGEPGQPGYLVAGRPITRSHYEAVADLATGFAIGDRVQIRRNRYTVVGLTRRMVSSSGDPMVFIPLKDAQEAQFLKDNDAIVAQRRRSPRCSKRSSPPRPPMPLSTPCWCDWNPTAIPRPWPKPSPAGSGSRCTPGPRWRRSWWASSSPPPPGRSPCSW